MQVLLLECDMRAEVHHAPKGRQREKWTCMPACHGFQVGKLGAGQATMCKPPPLSTGGCSLPCTAVVLSRGCEPYQPAHLHCVRFKCTKHVHTLVEDGAASHAVKRNPVRLQGVGVGEWADRWLQVVGRV